MSDDSKPPSQPPANDTIPAPPPPESFGHIEIAPESVPPIPKGAARLAFTGAMQDLHEAAWRLQQIGDAVARALDAATEQGDPR